MGKAFEKQIKTIEDQGEKQAKAIEENGKQLISQKYSVPLTRQDKIFNDLIDERMENIENLNNYVDFTNLKYHYKGDAKDVDFSNFINAKTLFDGIKHKKIKLANAIKNQKEFNSKLRDIKTGLKNKKKIK